MGRLSKEEQARRDGMQWARRVAESGGLEALIKECEARNISNLPVGVLTSEAQQFCNNVKMNTLDAVTVLSLTVLEDEFGFTREQCNQFKERFNLKTECLLGDYVTWSELIEQLKDELDIKLDIRENRNNVILKG